MAHETNTNRECNITLLEGDEYKKASIHDLKTSGNTYSTYSFCSFVPGICYSVLVCISCCNKLKQISIKDVELVTSCIPEDFTWYLSDHVQSQCADISTLLL